LYGEGKFEFKTEVHELGARRPWEKDRKEDQVTTLHPGSAAIIH
jgi:hypothetical protein